MHLCCGGQYILSFLYHYSQIHLFCAFHGDNATEAVPGYPCYLVSIPTMACAWDLFKPVMSGRQGFVV